MNWSAGMTDDPAFGEFYQKPEVPVYIKKHPPSARHVIELNVSEFRLQC